MCKQCNELHNEFHQRISDLADQLHFGSDSAWEYSEPLGVGGPGQPKTYTLQSPFQHLAGQEYKVETAIAGQGNGIFLVSSDSTSILPGLTSADVGTTPNTNLTGLLFACPANTSMPVCSGWYTMPDGNGRLNVTVSSAQAIYVTIQFRRKR